MPRTGTLPDIQQQRMAQPSAKDGASDLEAKGPDRLCLKYGKVTFRKARVLALPSVRSCTRLLANADTA